jgi:hypothetical protein
MKTFEFTASAGVVDAKDTCFSGVLGRQSSSVFNIQLADSSILTIAKSCTRLEPFEGREDRSLSDKPASLCCFSDPVISFSRAGYRDNDEANRGESGGSLEKSQQGGV